MILQIVWFKVLEFHNRQVPNQTKSYFSKIIGHQKTDHKGHHDLHEVHNVVHFVLLCVRRDLWLTGALC